MAKKRSSSSGYTLDPGQRQAATKHDYFKKRWAEMPKMPKTVLPFPRRRKRPGLSPLPYPRSRK